MWNSLGVMICLFPPPSLNMHRQEDESHFNLTDPDGILKDVPHHRKAMR